MRSFMVTPLNLREMSQRLSPERTVYTIYPSDTEVAGLALLPELLEDVAAGPRLLV